MRERLTSGGRFSLVEENPDIKEALHAPHLPPKGGVCRRGGRRHAHPRHRLGVSDAWAVGRTQVNSSSFEGLALHWKGTAWSVSPGFSAALSRVAGASAAGVADISPGDAYAIGNSAATAVGSLVHWNGTAWSPVTLPLPAGANSNTTLDAISANGPGDVWIVGTFLDSANEQKQMPPVKSPNINAFFKFNGTAWSIVPSPSPGSIDVLSGVTTSDASDKGRWGPGLAAVPPRQVEKMSW